MVRAREIDAFRLAYPALAKSSQGKTTEARDTLTSVYGWFAEEFDSAGLKVAKAPLKELS